MYNSADIENKLIQLNENYKISRVLDKFPGNFVKKGNVHIGNCPICKAKGTFTVGEKYNNWDCIGCGNYGKGILTLILANFHNYNN
jgi:hypothetical protein